MTNSNKKEKSNKPKIEISRREASGKKKPDLFAKFRNTEHPLDNVIARPEEVFEIKETNVLSPSGATGTTTQTGTTGTTGTTSSTGTTGSTKPTGSTKHSISPEKNFTKTPNSIVKIALAQGLFRGKSKQIYDYLWLVSRGHISPTRKVRKTFNEIQKGSGLGSRNTVLAGIAHLEAVGLIVREKAVGESAGNTYEIFTPEELGLSIGTTGTTNTTGTTDITGTTQNLVIPVLPDFGTTGTIQTPVNTGGNESSKTLFKTNTNEDEEIAFSSFIKTFAAASKRITGKGISRRDREQWGKLAELLVLELETAARRSGSVMNIPAFLTEVLRRQFFASRQAQSSGKPSKIKADTVGKSESGTYEIKQLDEKGREAALEQLREFAGDELLGNFQKWYTPEDWEWLTKQLDNAK